MIENKSKKELFVGRAVKSLKETSKSYEITFSLPKTTAYCIGDDNSEKLFRGLMDIVIKETFSNIPIRGLTLHWDHVEELGVEG